MSDKLNMALDDVIKQNKKGGKKGGAAGGKKPQAGAPGRKKVGGKKLSRPVKPVSGKAAERGKANQVKKAGKTGTGRGAGTKKLLRPTPSAPTELFGALTRCLIDYDNLGKSKHTAHIEYESPESAKKAIDEYHGNTLDGKKIEVRYADIKKDVPGIRKKAPFKQREELISRQPERRDRSRSRDHDRDRSNQQSNRRRGGGGAGGRNRRGGRGAANKKKETKA